MTPPPLSEDGRGSGDHVVPPDHSQAIGAEDGKLNTSAVARHHV